jgi:hypothetical protein
MARGKNADEQAASGGMEFKTDRTASGKELSGFADCAEHERRHRENGKVVIEIDPAPKLDEEGEKETVGRGDVIQFHLDKPFEAKRPKKDAPVMNHGRWGKPPATNLPSPRAARPQFKLLREVPASWRIKSSHTSEVRKIDPKSVDATALLEQLKKRVA